MDRFSQFTPIPTYVELDIELEMHAPFSFPITIEATIPPLLVLI